MPAKIRLMRMGKKKQPTYRVVVADSRSPRDGRFIEIIGQYAPRADPSVVTIDSDKAVAWLAKGAQPTEQVGKLLEIAGVWERYRIETGKEAAARPRPKVPKPKKAKAVEEPAAVEPPASETPAAAEAAEASAAEALDTAEATGTDGVAAEAAADAEGTSE